MVKKVISAILWVSLLVALMTQATFGANNVSDITVDVVIDEDGSATITQTWNCNFTEGTEGYIPIENLGEMSLSDFQVSDVNGVYTTIEDWKIDGSFEDKAGKCGLVKTEKGYELCWGITAYGENRYAIEYKLSNLVGSYTDFDGFNFQFINTGMGTLPTDVTVKINLRNGTKLDANNAGIWAFGFDGQIHFENGQVIAYTDNPLSSDSESVIIMLQLNKEVIHPTRVMDGTFEAVKALAIKGSDYEESMGTDEVNTQQVSIDNSPDEQLPGGVVGEIFGYLMGFMILGVFALPFVLLFLFILRKGVLKKNVNTLYNKADYFREVPIAGNLEATFTLARSFGQTKDEGNLIGAAFLKLINAGCLEPISEKTTNLFGKEKEEISLRLVHPPEFIGITANRLYELLVLASSSDRVLEEYELENYCRRNYRSMIKILEEAKQDGRNTLVQINSYDSSKAAKPLGLSKRGEKLLMDIIGFKKYLLEFSLIGERTLAESIIWQDYLTFAALLGIADTVLEQFERVYPDTTQYNENARYYYLLAHRYGKASYDSTELGRSSGRGGKSSFGGGGGFSGGGRGGGAR